jgi:hypothetical protein
MITWQIILAFFAFLFIAGIFVTAVVISRFNDDLGGAETDEPMGDMVDARRVISRFED